ncbi:MAG: ATP-binding protein [Propionibacteriaceae bacterium]|nr:ATP-binding protein [Propionibacteriaceae bacterium]
MSPGTDLSVPLFRVLAWMRYVLAALTIVVNVTRLDEARLPVLVGVTSVLIVVQSVLLHWLYAGRGQVRGWVLGLDFGVTVCLLALSPAIGSPGQTLPVTGFWSAAAPVAIALARGWGLGAAAALGLCLVAFVQHPDLRPEAWGLLVVLVISTGGLGYLVDQLRRVSVEHQRLSATTAHISERQRLARIVHDGVLQVLAMVEREAPGLGARGEKLALMAREQEGQLRALIQDSREDVTGERRGGTGRRNLAALLDRHASATVTVSTPVEPVLIAQGRAAEINAAVQEALTNVTKHAGPGARAWVLLEVEDDEVVVSIRDSGVGGDPEAFADAMHADRMGMKHSIYGRIRDLGGTATLGTAPGRGVEWEFRVPTQP